MVRKTRSGGKQQLEENVGAVISKVHQGWLNCGRPLAVDPEDPEVVTGAA